MRWYGYVPNYRRSLWLAFDKGIAMMLTNDAFARRDNDCIPAFITMWMLVDLDRHIGKSNWPTAIDT